MTLLELLTDMQRLLEGADVPMARLDCLVIMEHVTGKNRAHLLAHPELEIVASQTKQIQKLVNRRAEHIPLSYVLSKTEFYGRQFTITPAVLEPRPESETMIDTLKRITGSNSVNSTSSNNKSWRIVDVGTGSGALGITAALELKLSSRDVVLVDIDEAALAVAKQNCERFELDLTCIVDDLLTHAQKRGAVFDIVLANLPYVPNDYHINTAAQHEPRLAIFGGADGLELYGRLFKQLGLLKPDYVLTESLPFQHKQLATIAKRFGYYQQLEDDFIQLFKSA